MPPSNIFKAPADEIRELFADYLDGSPEAVSLTLSAAPLNETTRNAIERTLDGFAYGAESCIYVTLHPQRPDGAHDDIALDGQALFLLIESLDPLIVLCTDAQATESLAQAYRTSFACDAPARAFGRSAVMFKDLSELLATEDGKKRAWHLLKSLPKRVNVK